jgi:hypothetical protein
LTTALLSACACDRRPTDATTARSEGQSGVASGLSLASDPSASAGSPERTTTAARVEQSTSTHTGAPDADGADRSRSAAREQSASVAATDDMLVGEERERDPHSDTVKIKVLGGDRRQAHVLWGRKDLGVAPLEIERPRNSGPLDLVVIAPGFLPFHTRAFTDRDDLISFHLYTAAEAPQLLGYRASEVPAPPLTGVAPPVNQNGLENPSKNARPSTARDRRQDRQ